MSDKVFTPLAPLPKYYDSNPRATLTETEQGMYDEVLAHFVPESYALPGIEKGELMDQEKFWLSRECLLRFLRASKWKVDVAIRRLEATLKWRREFGIYDKVTADHVEPEAVTGKEILYGFDTKGKPAFYMIPSRQNTDDHVRQVEFAFWGIERCVDLMQPGVETIALLINFAQRAKNPSLGVARQVLNILQEHYPERLGLAVVINIPFFINAFFKVILPFVDPVTREKLKFNVDPIKEGIFEPDMCMSDGWGGIRNFEYDHEKYWKALVEQAEANVTKWTKNWRALGAKIGVSEWDYKQDAVLASEMTEASDPKHEESVSVVPVVAVASATAAVAALTIDPEAPEPTPVKIPEVVIQPATAVPSDALQDEKKPGTKDAVVNTTTVAASGQGESNAGGAVATGGGDSGAGGGDGGAAE